MDLADVEIYYQGKTAIFGAYEGKDAGECD